MKAHANGWQFFWQWLWVALAAVACIRAGPVFLDYLHVTNTRIVDFFQDWASARNVSQGLPAYGDQEEMLERYLDVYRSPGSAVFNEINGHPPSSVLAVLPLARLDYPTAFLVWGILSLAALAVSIWLIVSELRVPYSLWTICPILTLLLTCNPLAQQMMQGQPNLFLLLLLTCAWVADRRGYPWLAGSALGIATALKLFPGLLFLYFLVHRQWRVLFAGTTAFASLTGLTALVMGAGVYRDFLTRAMPQVGEYRSSWMNVSIPGFWSRLFNLGSHGGNVIALTSSPMLAWTGTIVCVLVVLSAWITVILGARSKEARDQAFGLGITAMLLISPITWDHYLVMLLLPAMIIWTYLQDGLSWRASFVVLLLILWITPGEFWSLFMGATPEGWYWMKATPLQSVCVLAIPCYALTGLFVLGVANASVEKCKP